MFQCDLLETSVLYKFGKSEEGRASRYSELVIEARRRSRHRCRS